MQIEVRPITRAFSESELVIDGAVVGEIEVDCDGRLCARLILKDKDFLGGSYSSIFGYGETNEEAVCDAIRVGRRQQAALNAALSELESRVLATA